MPLADLDAREHVVRSVVSVQRRFVTIGLAFLMLTALAGRVFNTPPAGLAVAVPLGTVIVLWGLIWYGILARAAATGESILAVVVTRRVSLDHAYLVAQPVDGGPALSLVVPARNRLRDGEPTALIGDRSTGRLVLASAGSVTVPLQPARPR